MWDFRLCLLAGRCLCLCLYFLHATGHQDHSCCPGEVRDLRELRGGHGREAAEQVPDLVRDPKVHAEGRLCRRGNVPALSLVKHSKILIF